MPTNEHDDRGERDAGEAGSDGTLVVLSPVFGPFARTKLWVKKKVEGYDLLAVPRLHIEQHAAIQIVGGLSPAKLFENIEIITPHWSEKIVGYIGGQWMFYKLARSEFSGVGFVLGEPKFEIERAVRGITKILT
jgi:hypothetical protein